MAWLPVRGGDLLRSLSCGGDTHILSLSLKTSFGGTRSVHRDGDIGGRKGDRPTVKRPKGFSFNLRLPGDPVTPPPESTRPKRNRLSNTTKANSPDGVLKQAQQAADLDDTKMTVSLAAEFGIDDMSGSGNNPYGTTSSAQYGKFFVLRNF